MCIRDRANATGESAKLYAQRPIMEQQCSARATSRDSYQSCMSHVSWLFSTSYDCQKFINQQQYESCMNSFKPPTVTQEYCSSRATSRDSYENCMAPIYAYREREQFKSTIIITQQEFYTIEQILRSYSLQQAQIKLNSLQNSNSVFDTLPKEQPIENKKFLAQ
eukprot:TRINITY_DN196_c0_g2_i2.p1 TRINITY_DN196_c0_g2~~TRINITY_DN196_c0_g2_i2.p1  ORF type:complete len:179 (+),score=42.29 TRINITY_DN196_c0_g2_i2:48-539(+)